MTKLLLTLVLQTISCLHLTSIRQTIKIKINFKKSHFLCLKLIFDVYFKIKLSAEFDGFVGQIWTASHQLMITALKNFFLFFFFYIHIFNLAGLKIWRQTLVIFIIFFFFFWLTLVQWYGATALQAIIDMAFSVKPTPL